MEDVTVAKRAGEETLKVGALQSEIFNSANFELATDEKGVIKSQCGAERTGAIRPPN